MDSDIVTYTSLVPQASKESPDTGSSTRSQIMSRIRSKNTAPEMEVRRALHRAGHRYRIHRADLPGCPDLLFPRQRVALFVNGCFWHWHGCERSRMPKSNVDYWTAKIHGNVERDKRTRSELEGLGWKWRVIWECEIPVEVERLSRELSKR